MSDNDIVINVTVICPSQVTAVEVMEKLSRTSIGLALEGLSVNITVVNSPDSDSINKGEL